jgi:KDO2-lipid IV(A) lauroyltransferase
MFAWRNAAKVPDPILRAGFALAADVMWLLRSKGVRRMEANYARIRPECSQRALRQLSRQGMRSYMRYYREAFTLQSCSTAEVDARVRVEGWEHVDAVCHRGGTAILALAHLGNWDLAGAWASRNLAPVLTVAEKLKPEELYQEFLAFRRSVGIEVLGLGDPGVFRDLARGLRDGPRVVPLLADRDLTETGVEVLLAGHPAHVAAGPATLALATGADLIPLGIWYERLDRSRRRIANTPWGIVLHFYPPVSPPSGEPSDGRASGSGTGRRNAQVTAMTQGWVDTLTETITAHTQDWHMLQRVFLDDLDPARVGRPRGAGSTQPRTDEPPGPLATGVHG